MVDSPDEQTRLSDADPWLEIGTVVAPQGLKGELRILSSSDFPERFQTPGERWLQDPKGLNPPRSVQLLRGRFLPGKNIYVVRLADIEDRQQAECLRDYRLLVARSDRPPLGEDEYHVADLVGLSVYHQLTGKKIGVVTDLLTAGNDLLEVHLDAIAATPSENLPEETVENENTENTDAEKSRKVLIPFVKAIVTSVDLEQKRIELLPPGGLLELTHE
jgi:16S rRNA processing protein RimM